MSEPIVIVMDNEWSALGPECVLDLPDGTSVSLTLEQAGELWEKMPEVYHEGRRRRVENQASFANPSAYGLRPVTGFEPEAGIMAWSTPEATGVWPAGVPMLSFVENKRHSNIMRRGLPWMRRDNSQESEPDPPAQWTLAFSRVAKATLMQCQWDDIEGFKRLVSALLETNPETLMTQLMLQIPSELRAGLEGDGERICDSSRRLLDLAEEIPDLDVNDYLKVIGPGITLSQACVFDPQTFRYVKLPGILLALGDSHGSLAQLDKSLSQVGLVSLKGFSTQGWGDIQRLAVKKGFGRRAGKVSNNIWQVLGVEPQGSSQASHPNFSVGWFRETLTRSLGVVRTDPLGWQEWKTLKKQ